MASIKCKMESGIQLLARLSKKTGIERFYPIIFESGPKLGDFIEIYGEGSTTCLLGDLICECLIPNDLNGPEASIIVFNTDGKLTLDYLINLSKIKLSKRLKNSTNKPCHDSKVINSLLNLMLKNLFILDIYNTTQFYTSIQNLEFFLTKYSNVSLCIFDTLTAFYWDEQNLQKATKMDSYVKKLLRIVQKIVKDFKITVLYSRPEYFSTSKESIENLEPCYENSESEQINYRIQIVYNEKDVNLVNVRTYNKQFQKKFHIFNDEIVWL
ncbi:unnamed protein product [Euphydryas editha]|uniref:XRCC2 n=1 Tax=Euphydryas editha TaxID=104508 RepID=A0AAU9URI2_EUPED|nr:unnamed protein product [Euphydryas editha]